MPTYEYGCDDPSCDVVTEKICRHTERYDAPPCRKCGGPTHQVIRTAPTFNLRGGGWAQDGYGSAKSKKTT